MIAQDFECPYLKRILADDEICYKCELNEASCDKEYRGECDERNKARAEGGQRGDTS